MDGAVPHLYVSADRPRFGGAVAVTLLLNAALVLCGFLSRHDNLLDLLKAGEVQAVAPPPQEEAPQVQLELEPVLPPPPVDDPAFVLPIEEEKPPPPDTPPPPPDPEPPPVAQEPPPPPEPEPPAPPVETPPPPAPAVAATPEPTPVPTPPAPAVAMEQPSFRPGDPNLPKPLYPMQAKLRRQQGTVLLSIVLAAGRVASVSVAQSSGYGILDSSARKWAAEKWTFPPQYSGNFEVPVAFQLDSQ